MKDCNLVEILKSKAVTVLVIALCAVFLMKETKKFLKDVKLIEPDNEK